MTKSVLNICLIIPVYRHLKPLVNILRQLEPQGLTCFVVDDGNETPIRENRPWIKVTRLDKNRGKGAACLEGSRVAFENGFTHAIFIDADEQHRIQDISTVHTLINQHPDAMILGRPLFDQTAPLKRRWGRWVSNIWVWIETLSFDIKDSLCGFRCLPLGPLLKISSSVKLGQRMDFDPEILVRLYWQGVPVVTFDTRIQYPSQGLSNFRLWHDNVALFRIHTKLFFGMLIRSPFLLTRHGK